MKEDIIHINIGVNKTDEGIIVATYSVRIWSHLLKYLNDVIKNPIPSGLHFQQGFVMTVISNSAISVEGFIADLIDEYIVDKPHLKTWNDNDLNLKGWSWKKDIYNKLFEKKLESYMFYEDIAYLIQFRNNVAHGRTYRESTTKDIKSSSPTDINAENSKYNNVREFLIKRGLLMNSNISSTSEVPWKLNVAMYFLGVVKEFMKVVLRENESDNKLGIEAEFNLLVVGK